MKMPKGVEIVLLPLFRMCRFFMKNTQARKSALVDQTFFLTLVTIPKREFETQSAIEQPRIHWK